MGKVNLMNRTYHLCIEDRYAAAVMQEWLRLYKPAPLSIRNADERKGIYGCFVLSVQDRDGRYLDFIEKVARLTSAKVKAV